MVENVDPSHRVYFRQRGADWCPWQSVGPGEKQGSVCLIHKLEVTHVFSSFRNRSGIADEALLKETKNFVFAVRTL